MKLSTSRILEILEKNEYRYSGEIAAGLKSGRLELKGHCEIPLGNLASVYSIRLELAQNNPGKSERLEAIEYCKFMLELGRTAVQGNVLGVSLGPRDVLQETFLAVVRVEPLDVLRCDRFPIRELPPC